MPPAVLLPRASAPAVRLAPLNPGRPQMALGMVGRMVTKLGANDPQMWSMFGGKSAFDELVNFRHPFYDRPAPVYLGDYVTLEAGTGLVHSSPAYGVDDFLSCKRYGMSNDDIARYQKDAVVGHRPTWSKGSRENTFLPSPARF